jgi:hypothetical protein
MNTIVSGLSHGLALWRRYTIDELGNLSIFRNTERLKIISNSIDS